MDDGDIMCHPIVVPCYLEESDKANAKVGAERNPLKTRHLLRRQPGLGAIRIRPTHRQSRRHSGHAPAGQLRQDQQTEFALVRESLESQPCQSHIACPRPHFFFRNDDEAGRRSLERLFPSLTDDSITQATISAGQ